MKRHHAQFTIEHLEPRIAPANVLAKVVGGHLIITGDSGDNALELIETAGGSEQSVSYLLRAADGSTTINGSPDPLEISAVSGDVRVSLGAGDDLLRAGTAAGGSLRVLRDLRIAGGAGDNVIELHGSGGFAVGRNLHILNGAGDDRVDALNGLAVEGNILISNGPGSSSTRLRDFGANHVQISTGAGAEALVEISGAAIHRNLTVATAGPAETRIVLGASEPQAETDTQIAGNLRVVAGPGSSQLEMTSVDVLGSAAISTRKGADGVSLDDLYVRRDFSLSTGDAGDVVKVDLRSGTGFSTALDGNVFVNLGAGDDLLRLGLAGNVTTGVEIYRASSWAGGRGRDRLDAANLVTFGPEPQFLQFDRYGAPPLLETSASYNIGSRDAGTYPIDLLAADLDRDGVLDVVAVDEELETLNILFGNADGTFDPEVVIPAGPTPGGIAIGDFDHQLGPDLIVTSRGEGAASVFLNDGSGGFGPRVAFTAGTNLAPIAPAAADFNGDGHLDIATLNRSGHQDASVSVLLGSGAGTFTFFQTFELDGENIDYFGAPNDFALGDIDGDGTLDLAATGLRGLGVLLSNGDGTFRVRVEQQAVASGLDLGDLNGDGKTDLLLQAFPLVAQLGTGDGTFLAPTIVSTNATGEPVTGDFNGDGALDVAVTRFNSRGDLLEVLLGNGNGTFQPALVFQASEDAGPIVSGDFNRDGFLDVAIADSYAARIAVLLNAGRAA